MILLHTLYFDSNVALAKRSEKIHFNFIQISPLRRTSVDIT